MLRDGLLTGTTIVIADAGELGHAAAQRATALGAHVEHHPEHDGPADVLVYDATPADGARAALDAAWLAIRPVATGAMIDRGGGRIVLLAPPPGGAQAAAARAGLENLARTLSVEWARFQVRPVTILPGAETSPADVAELVAFLASPAGEYYSGCAFELGAATS